MDTHEIILFRNEPGSGMDSGMNCGDTNVTATADLHELEHRLASASVQACVIDCDDHVEEVFARIAELRPELTIALCERFDFQRLVVASETARLHRLRVVASLWRQSAEGIIAEVNELIRAESDEDWDVAPTRPVVAPLRADRHPRVSIQAAHH